jgi:sugar phosphate isomerase/epimerase
MKEQRKNTQRQPAEAARLPWTLSGIMAGNKISVSRDGHAWFEYTLTRARVADKRLQFQGTISLAGQAGVIAPATSTLVGTLAIPDNPGDQPPALRPRAKSTTRRTEEEPQEEVSGVGWQVMYLKLQLPPQLAAGADLDATVQLGVVLDQIDNQPGKAINQHVSRLVRLASAGLGVSSVELNLTALNQLLSGESSLAATAWPAGRWERTERPNSKINGVQVGVQSYSFRDRPLDEAIKAMVEIGLSSCELTSSHLEPRARLAAEAKAKDTDPRELRAKFDRAGIALTAYSLGIRDDFTEAEIERGFEMARALGVKVITSSSNISTVRRIDPFAKRHRLRVGLHNHSTIRPNELATPDDFARALRGASEYMAINLDIGHFTAANCDAVAFLRRHHERIVSLHIKDRQRDHGPQVPFGQGDAPIREVLTLLRQNQWPIPAHIEYEYEGEDTIEEVRRCLAYCQRALSA